MCATGIRLCSVADNVSAVSDAGIGYAISPPYVPSFAVGSPDPWIRPLISFQPRFSFLISQWSSSSRSFRSISDIGSVSQIVSPDVLSERQPMTSCRRWL
jgi:hypothetical protein